jgi:hypothetical protein
MRRILNKLEEKQQVEGKRVNGVHQQKKGRKERDAPVGNLISSPGNPFHKSMTLNLPLLWREGVGGRGE